MNVTEDSLFDGKLVLYQYDRGYRFSVDSILLAGLTRVYKGDKVIDLGCGCGVVGLILAFRYKGISVLGVEIQDSLVELAKKNVEVNNLDDVLSICQCDIRTISDFLQPEGFDLVVSNPPYRKEKTGRINPNYQKAIARHEISLNISDVFKASRYLLKDKGRVAIIYTADRLDELIISAEKFSFAIKELQIIYSYPGGSAKLVYGLFRKGGGRELKIAPPFFVYSAKGSKEYAPEMKKLYEP